MTPRGRLAEQTAGNLTISNLD